MIRLVAAVGVLIAFGGTAQAQGGGVPTYTKDVARIFQERCQTCHYPGAPFAPMALTTYPEVRPWVKSIHKQVASGTMPPWHADPAYGEFKNDISLSAEEIDTIVRWVEARAPRGNPRDMPDPKPVPGEWRLGEPDMVLDIGRDVAVPESGTIPLKGFSIDTNLEKDMWLSGLEIQPGNLDVVKEVVVYVKNPDGGIVVPDGGSLGNGRLGFYARGRTASQFNEGHGKLIKRGAQLVVGILYVPNGTATTDRTRLGLHFQEGPVRNHVITRAVGETKFEIEPHIPDFPIYATYEFTEPVTLWSMRPEMHYRGSSFKFIAHYPDGRDEILLQVNDYDYEWQTYYYPRGGVKLPAGTVLECIAIMDNSHENFDNPEPHAVVRYGDQPTDEKMFGWIDYTRDAEDLTKGASGS